jgi:hypothetical protein
MTSVYRREIVSFVFRVAVATNVEIAESDEKVADPFLACRALEPHYRDSGHEWGFAHAVQKDSSSSSDDSTLRTFLFRFSRFP